MKMRYLALGAVLAFATASTGWAQTNTNTNNNVNMVSGAFGGPFVLQSNDGNMRISQSGANATDSSGFCQFFSFNFGFMSMWQIITDDGMQSGFGTPPEDPCV